MLVSSPPFFKKRRRRFFYLHRILNIALSPSGEIGRHSGLKIRRYPEKGRTGSIPVSGTNSIIVNTHKSPQTALIGSVPIRPYSPLPFLAWVNCARHVAVGYDSGFLGGFFPPPSRRRGPTQTAVHRIAHDQRHFHSIQHDGGLTFSVPLTTYTNLNP